MMNLFHRLRPWLSLAALAIASTGASAQTCPNQVGFAFTVSTNVGASNMVLMGERYQGTGQYAAQLVLSPEIMAHLATSLAAGCTQRVNYAGGGIYDQANVNAYWPASYFPVLFIALP
jgi:hypothetical protein